MTSRYPLRSRMGTAPASSDTRGESPPTISISTSNMAPGANNTAERLGVTARSYRDAAAPRSVFLSAASQHDGGSLVEPDSPSVGLVPRETSLNKELTDGASKLTSLTSVPDDEGGPWTLVAPRRTRSAESLRGRGSASGVHIPREVASPGRNVLTWEQERAIMLAQESMSTNKCTHIKEQNTKLNVLEVGSDDDPSGVVGPSKGKCPDPRDWGNAGIKASEMDIGAQRAAFEAYTREHLAKIPVNPTTPIKGHNTSHTRGKYQASVEEVDDINEPSKPVQKPVPLTQGHKHKLKKPGSTHSAMEGVRFFSMADTARDRIARTVAGRSTSTSEKPGVRPEMRPVSQIAPGSYLANALANVGQNTGSNPGSPSSSDSSSSSSESSSETDTSSSDSSSRRKRRRGHHGKRNSRTSKRKRTSSKSLLKPIAPKEYDGMPDARAYHQFVTEGSDYVQTGKVSKTRQVFVLSYYLKGRAYDFYTQKVSLNVQSWTLQRFFEELFNYCFPINYRMKQRERLRRAFQHEKSVSDYCYELEELYNMIGTIDECEKVIKLWNGLRSSLQKGLWRDGLNPEVCHAPHSLGNIWGVLVQLGAAR